MTTKQNVVQTKKVLQTTKVAWIQTTKDLQTKGLWLEVHLQEEMAQADTNNEKLEPFNEL